jgi:SpoVK/Ycf46/Vps4 family AAA+-type ATPase
MKRRRTTSRPDPGVFDPHMFWGQVLPSPATTAEPDRFDARVERALRFMRNMFFTPEEHAAMAEAVVRLVSQKQESDQSPNTHPRCP